MSDIVNKSTHSKMMSLIRSKNTGIEMAIRKRLWAKGFRYRLQESSLPRKPDLIFYQQHAVIFVNGCFWHGHDCSLFRMPKTRADFWKSKIAANKKNNRKAINALFNNSWKVLVIWECVISGKTDIFIDRLVVSVIKWLTITKKMVKSVEIIV